MKVFPKKKTDNCIMENDVTNDLKQWGTTIAIFLAVILALVINFCVNSHQEAAYAVRDELIMRSEDYAEKIAYEFEVSLRAAETVAKLMADCEEFTQDNFAWYAEELKSVLDNIYMVIIADSKGVGYTQDGQAVDISASDYYSVSRTNYYYRTADDGVTREAAYVLCVPVYVDNISVGNIYLFMSKEDVAAMIPLGGYDLEASFIVADNKGNLIATAGAETVFLENDDFIGNLRNARFTDKSNSADRVVNRFSNMSGFVFSAEYRGEEKSFVSVPLGVTHWQYITVLNQDYVDRLVTLDWKSARNMTIQLGIAAALFVIFVAVILFVNRRSYNERNKELADKADTDLLTGLNNKIATERKIQEYLDRNPEKQCLFFMFDIDNFKKINDTLGHAFGDEVLRTLGKQLTNEFRVTDIIGRTGGDEFILFLKDINDEVLAQESERLTNLFHSLQAGEYVKYSPTSSIGAAIYPRDAKDYQGLYTAADSALYEAKKQGKNRMVFYNKNLKQADANPERKTPIESDMR